MWRPSMRLRGRPTISRTRRAARMPSASSCSTAGRAGCVTPRIHRRPDRRRVRGEPSNAVEIFVALGETIRSLSLPVRLFEDLLSAFRQDVTVKRYGTWDARHGLLPAIREPGRPPRPAHRRVPRRAARRLVRCDVRRASADELLAGRESRLRQRTDLPARGRARAARRDRGRSGRGSR